MAAPMTYRPAPRRASAESKNLADLYGLPILDWDRIAERLEEGMTQAPDTGGPDRHTCWLATINQDGSPHVTAVGALWVDGTFWFETGKQTRKGRNLARDPRCSLSLATHASMAERWSDHGWPARVDESGVNLTAEFGAPSAGPPPWAIYRLVASRATALQTVEPGGATQWRFRST
jgi:Pyridoxamine 5'-phosphate oxidase